MMRAILIDPHSETVSEVEIHNAELDTLQEAIGADSIDFSSLGSGVKAVVDDLGLYRPGQRYWFFNLPGGLVMMAGKALLVSMAPDGELDGLTHKATLDYTRSIVAWLGDRHGAEQAILSGRVKRPEIAVNGNVVWQWTPESEGKLPATA